MEGEGRGALLWGGEGGGKGRKGGGPRLPCVEWQKCCVSAGLCRPLQQGTKQCASHNFFHHHHHEQQQPQQQPNQTPDPQAPHPTPAHVTPAMLPPPPSRLLPRLLPSSYRYFIFLNSSAKGPFYPAWLPPSWHWTHAFLEKLQVGGGGGAVWLGGVCGSQGGGGEQGGRSGMFRVWRGFACKGQADSSNERAMPSSCRGGQEEGRVVTSCCCSCHPTPPLVPMTVLHLVACLRMCRDKVGCGGGVGYCLPPGGLLHCITTPYTQWALPRD